MEMHYEGEKEMKDHIVKKIAKLTRNAPEYSDELLELICTAEEFTILMGSQQQEGYLMTQVESSLPDEMLLEYYTHLR